MKKIDYKLKKKHELEWWKSKKDTKSFISKLLWSKLLYAPYRISFSKIFPKIQMRNFIYHHIGNKNVEKLLIAPCGTGIDYIYLKEFSDNIYGIDLSPIAIKRCPLQIHTKIGDILHSGYEDESFDLIVSPLFFHHIVNIGFHYFLNEFYRILKHKGKLIILDFSIFYPLNAITRPMKKLFNNPYGEVEDEKPFRPKILTESLKHAGFINLDLVGASFSHCSFYIPVAKFVNKISKRLLNKWLFKNIAWMVLFWGEKP